MTLRDKDQQSSMPSTMVSSNDQISLTSLPQHQEQEARQQYKRFSCFYCSQTYSSDKERIKHIDSEHPGKLYYPTQEDFENRLCPDKQTRNSHDSNMTLKFKK
jgi:hypothetical protein